MTTEPAEFPKLERPPIHEVVCGFVFQPARLDVLDLGAYWEERRDEYPSKALHPPIMDEHSVLDPAAPFGSRAWFVSEHGDVLLQLQRDRFYMNWRARGGVYPRFSDRDGQKGLKSLALVEWQRYRDFIQRRTGAQPPPLARVEVSKIDVLERGTHWKTLHDLGTLLKVATVFNDVRVGETANLHLQFTESDAVGTTNVVVQVTGAQVRIDARAVLPANDEPDALFTRANHRLNEVFFRMLDREQMIDRFGIAP